MMQNKLYISSHYLYFNNLMFPKNFSKHLYQKFLIYNKFKNMRKKKIFIFDNYFEFFFFRLKKKYIKKLSYYSKFKSAFFFKAELFIYKHSKLKIYNFMNIKFKRYIKKNIYFNLKFLKNSLFKHGLLFIHKAVRGGFIGFFNNFCGFIPLKFLKKQKKKIFFLKNYIICRASCNVSYFNTNYSMLRVFTSGLRRNFSKIKKKLRRFFFKRFRFIFSFNFFFLKKYLKYFLENFLFIKTYQSKYLFFSILLKILSLVP